MQRGGGNEAPHDGEPKTQEIEAEMCGMLLVRFRKAPRRDKHTVFSNNLTHRGIPFDSRGKRKACGELHTPIHKERSKSLSSNDMEMAVFTS